MSFAGDGCGIWRVFLATRRTREKRYGFYFSPSSNLFIKLTKTHIVFPLPSTNLSIIMWICLLVIFSSLRDFLWGFLFVFLSTKNNTCTCIDPLPVCLLMYFIRNPCSRKEVSCRTGNGTQTIHWRNWYSEKRDGELYALLQTCRNSQFRISARAFNIAFLNWYCNSLTNLVNYTWFNILNTYLHQNLSLMSVYKAIIEDKNEDT